MNRAPAFRPGGSYVYVIGEAGCTDAHKIGVADNPIKRLAQAQTYNYRRLELRVCFEIDGSDLRETLEKAVHRALRPYHLLGEWFEVSAEKAEATIRQMADMLGIAVTPAATRPTPAKIVSLFDATRIKAG